MTRGVFVAWIAVLASTADMGVRQARADLLDFERRPNGALPADNAQLANPYTIEGGGTVRFFFDVNGNNVFDSGIDALPRFERAGNADSEIGFVGSVANDTADPGFEGQLGDFFLRHPDFDQNVPGPFIADYDTAQTITALSGEIWDIDGTNAGLTEQWRVDVLDASGVVLATTLSPLGTLPTVTAPLDGKPWLFAFTDLELGADKVRLTFIGTKTTGIGLAFNNFSPTTAAVPEPASLVMLGTGALGLLGYGWRRRRVNHA